jgi:hypothetical protein
MRLTCRSGKQGDFATSTRAWCMFYTIQEIWILRDNSDKFRFEIVARSITRLFVASLASTCIMLKNKEFEMISLYRILSTSSENANSICSANFCLPGWVLPAFLVNSSPHGWASPVDQGDNTTRFATPTLTRFNTSSRLFPIMAPLTLGCHLHKTVNNGEHSGLNG